MDDQEHLNRLIRGVCQRLHEQQPTAREILVLGQSALFLQHMSEDMQEVCAWASGEPVEALEGELPLDDNIPVFLTFDFGAVLNNPFIDLRTISSPYSIIHIEETAYDIHVLKPEMALWSLVGQMNAIGFTEDSPLIGMCLAALKQTTGQSLGESLSTLSRHKQFHVGEWLETLIYFQFTTHESKVADAFSRDVLSAISYMGPDDARYLKASCGQMITGIDRLLACHLDPELEVDAMHYAACDGWLEAEDPDLNTGLRASHEPAQDVFKN